MYFFCYLYYNSRSTSIFPTISMSTQGTSSSLSSSSTTRWSFRKSFVDLVFAVWRWMGVWIFRKNEEVERGKSISLELVKEKEESRFDIITLS